MSDLELANKNSRMRFDKLSLSLRTSAFRAIRDDELAAKHAPQVINRPEFGEPTNLFYRASKDENGNTLIAYHYVWKYQKNDAPGFKAFLCRQIYSNPRRLHGLVFGKSDVELVVVKLDDKGQQVGLGFSTAENYKPGSFWVKHKFVQQNDFLNGKPKLEVMTWNHLFRKVEDSSPANGQTIDLKPQYFTDEQWQAFRMTKEKSYWIFKDRDQIVAERVSVREKLNP